MILSDRTLRALYPDYHGAIQPASIDLHLGDGLLVWPEWVTRDPRTDQADRWRPVPTEDRDGAVWALEPATRYLASTRERIAIPADCAGQVACRSSWGRDGLAVICGPAGYLDPGFVGHVTLELSVVGSDLIVWPGAAVCQLILVRLDRACERPYGGKYRGQSARPTPSRLHEEVRP